MTWHTVRELPAPGRHLCGLAWYAVDEQGIVVAVEAATGRERLRERVEGTPTGLTWDGKRLWYADFAGARLVAVEPGEPPKWAG